MPITNTFKKWKDASNLWEVGWGSEELSLFTYNVCVYVCVSGGKDNNTFKTKTKVNLG